MTDLYGGDRIDPGDVQRVTFPLAGRLSRGLEEQPVRDYLAVVEAEIRQLLGEKADLWQENQRLKVQNRQSGGDSYRPEEAHLQAVRILTVAQKTAEHYVADAQSYSRVLAEDARRHRDEILAEADEKALQIIENAHASAVGDVVSGFQNTGTVPGGTAEATFLRAFSEVYRRNLRTYLQQMLATVDEWDHAEQGAVSAGQDALPPGS